MDLNKHRLLCQKTLFVLCACSSAFASSDQAESIHTQEIEQHMMHTDSNIDPNKLLLPSSLDFLKPRLVQAAEIASASTECVSFVKGELKSIKPDKSKPIFRIICKNTSQQTFALLIDGDNFEFINVKGETRAQQHQRHLHQYWQICRKEIEKKTDKMTGVRWPEGGFVDPVSISDDHVNFEIDIDAKGFGGQPLLYRGYCEFQSLKNFSVELKGRPKADS
ncbi:hypothetical protein [Sessilibacter sp. MAH4]